MRRPRISEDTAVAGALCTLHDAHVVLDPSRQIGVGEESLGVALDSAIARTRYTLSVKRVVRLMEFDSFGTVHVAQATSLTMLTSLRKGVSLRAVIE